uniref:Uncharacterized protein n=1 Tax=Rhizophora mucronata TaxID=61149 RepID=A0A2P2JSU8_RHIMU
MELALEYILFNLQKRNNNDNAVTSFTKCQRKTNEEDAKFKTQDC